MTPKFKLGDRVLYKRIVDIEDGDCPCCCQAKTREEEYVTAHTVIEIEEEWRKHSTYPIHSYKLSGESLTFRDYHLTGV